LQLVIAVLINPFPTPTTKPEINEIDLNIVKCHLLFWFLLAGPFFFTARSIKIINPSRKGFLKRTCDNRWSNDSQGNFFIATVFLKHLFAQSLETRNLIEIRLF
jgi:hypothetical protein